MDHKRGRGRPRLHDAERLITLAFTLKPATYDTLARRAQQRGESLSAVVRSDVELAARLRATKAARDV